MKNTLKNIIFATVAAGTLMGCEASPEYRSNVPSPSAESNEQETTVSAKERFESELASKAEYLARQHYAVGSQVTCAAQPFGEIEQFNRETLDYVIDNGTGKLRVQYFCEWPVDEDTAFEQFIFEIPQRGNDMAHATSLFKNSMYFSEYEKQATTSEESNSPHFLMLEHIKADRNNNFDFEETPTYTKGKTSSDHMHNILYNSNESLEIIANLVRASICFQNGNERSLSEDGKRMRLAYLCMHDNKSYRILVSEYSIPTELMVAQAYSRSFDFNARGPGYTKIKNGFNRHIAYCLDFNKTKDIAVCGEKP